MLVRGAQFAWDFAANQIDKNLNPLKSFFTLDTKIVGKIFRIWSFHGHVNPRNPNDVEI